MGIKSISLVMPGAVLAMLSLNAGAAIIDNGSYTTDTSAGLDWLDVTASLGRSFDDVSGQFGPGGDFEGWRFATTDEFSTLLVHATGLATTEIANPYGYVLSNSDVTHDIVSRLGDTCSSCNATYDIRYTYGWLDLPADNHQGAGNGEVAIVFDYHTYDALYYGTHYSYVYGYAPDYPGDGRHYPTSMVSGTLGSFLVRATTVVPEPETYALMLAGLGLVALAARKRDQHGPKAADLLGRARRRAHPCCT